MPVERRRVLFLVPSFAGGAGGAERVVSLLLQHLDPGRFELHLALAQASNSHVDSLPSHVTVHDLKVSRMRYALPAVVQIVRRLKPHVVLSTVSYLNAMLLLTKPFLPRDTKLVLREASMPQAFIAEEAQQPRFFKWAYVNLYPRADEIICLSDAMLSDMMRFNIPRKKLVRIYNPIDVKGLADRARGENPFPGRGPNILSVGRLQRPKGVDILLNAMHSVLERLPNATLTIIGEGPLESALKQQARDLGADSAVNFAGFQANPWVYMKHADLFVLPSRFEGMPNALLESIALGTPAVASDCPGGVREVAQQFPQVVLVPTEDPVALAEAVVRRCQKHQRAAPPATLGEFDLQFVVEKYTRLLL